MSETGINGVEVSRWIKKVRGHKPIVIFPGWCRFFQFISVFHIMSL